MQTEDGLLMYCAKDPSSGTKETDYAAAKKVEHGEVQVRYR